jgi:hypothetical protein
MLPYDFIFINLFKISYKIPSKFQASINFDNKLLLLFNFPKFTNFAPSSEATKAPVPLPTFLKQTLLNDLSLSLR